MRRFLVARQASGESFPGRISRSQFTRKADSGPYAGTNEDEVYYTISAEWDVHTVHTTTRMTVISSARCWSRWSRWR